MNFSQLCPVILFNALVLGFSVYADSVVFLSHADCTELYFVVKTESESVVQLAIYDESSAELIGRTNPQLTIKSEYFRARIIVDGLSPKQRYAAHLFENGTLTHKFFVSTAPVKLEPHERYADSNFIFVSGAAGLWEPASSKLAPTLNTLSADALFLLGNSLGPNPNSNFTHNGFMKRWEQFQTIMSTSFDNQKIPIYPVIGGSDYGPIGADGRFYARSAALEAFNQAWNNPLLHLSLHSPLPAPPSQDLLGLRDTSLIRNIPLSPPESHKAACWSLRRGQVEFFALDCFSYKDPINGQFLGNPQLAWLESALLLSDAPLKIILAGAPILHPMDATGHFAATKEEYKRFFIRMDSLNIKGILFISGNSAGFGELSRVARAGMYPLRELVVGNLHDSPISGDIPLNYRREPGTLVKEAHFVHLNIKDTTDGVTLKWRILDTSGSEIWTETLFASDFGLAK